MDPCGTLTVIRNTLLLIIFIKIHEQTKSNKSMTCVLQELRQLCNLLGVVLALS